MVAPNWAMPARIALAFHLASVKLCDASSSTGQNARPGPDVLVSKLTLTALSRPWQAQGRQPLAFAELAQFTPQQANHLMGGTGYRLLNRECQVTYRYRVTTCKSSL